MAKKRILNISYPFGGLVRKYAYQTQAPYSSPDLLNVRGDDTIKGRERGGSRPGIDKAYSTELGSGNPIRFLNSVPWVNDSAYKVWNDLFNGTAIGGLWDTIGSDSLPDVTNDLAQVNYGTSGKAALQALSDLDNTKAYTVEIFIVPYNGELNGTYSVYAEMDATPNYSNNGIELIFTETGSSGGGTIVLNSYAGGVKTVVSSGTNTFSYAKAGWLTLHINGSTVTGYFDGVQVVSGTVSGLSGVRMGFGLECTVNGGMNLVSQFRTKYYSTTVSQDREDLLLASSNGVLYKNNMVGGMDTVTTSLTLADDRMIQGAPYLQKMYIADVSDDKASGTGGTVSGTTFDDASVSDWTTYGISANDDVVVISNGAGGTADGVYEISSVASGSITLATAPGDGTCEYTIQRAPKIYDPNTDTLSIWSATTGKGSVPAGCPLVCTYRDRLVLAGGSDNPYLWYMSRQGDPLDWDYGQLDSQRAVSGQGSDAGQIGEPITALISHSDDYLVFGCAHSLWILRGDPAYGGMIDALSYKIGIVDKQAWCKGPDSEIIFLSKDGLYALQPGANSFPQSISRERIPRELLDVSSDIYTVTLAYDIRFRGVHIYLSSENNQTVFHWWFDWETKTFWKVSLQGNYDPTALYEYYSADDEESSVLLGGRDGYIRKYNQYFETDGGNQINSYVMIGPIRLAGNTYYDGVLSEIRGVLGKDSGDVDWELLPDDTAEGTVEASTFDYSGTWEAGLNYADHPRCRGGSMILKLSGAESRRWSLERITATITQAGVSRKL